MIVSPETLHDAAETLTFEGDESSSGENCRFIDLENGWGLKCFEVAQDRDTAFTCQKYMASKNMAPLTGKTFDINDHDGCSWYCYVTEVVETVIPYGYQNSHSFTTDIEDDYLRWNMDEDEWEDEMEEARDEIYMETGCEYTDFHIGNWGYKNYNGVKKLIVIDFDRWTSLFNLIKSGLAP